MPETGKAKKTFSPQLLKSIQQVIMLCSPFSVHVGNCGPQAQNPNALSWCPLSFYLKFHSTDAQHHIHWYDLEEQIFDYILKWYLKCLMFIDNTCDRGRPFPDILIALCRLIIVFSRKCFVNVDKEPTADTTGLADWWPRWWLTLSHILIRRVWDGE